MLPLIRLQREIRDTMSWDDSFYLDRLINRHNVLKKLTDKYGINDTKTINKTLDTKKGKYLMNGKISNISIEEYNTFISKMIIMGFNQ
jgi:hypothetical protein